MKSKLFQNMNVIILHVIVISGAILTITPLLWMIFSSFKTVSEIFRFPPWALPEDLWAFNSYKNLLANWEFSSWFRNSLLYTISVVIFILFFTSLAGFGFAKYRFKGRNALIILLIGSTLIPFQLILIPLFIFMSRIGWTNSWESMIIPWVAPAFGIFLMRQYILSLPDELLDAARIDGASEFRIYWQIILPLSKPALVTVGILNFLGSWNSYIWPLMVLRGATAYTLPVGLATMISGAAGSTRPYGQAMAAATLISIPILILFVIMQKWVISGLTLGAVKQ